MDDSVSVLVVSHDVVGHEMAGPGIRYWELAGVLAQHFQVTLAVPGDAALDGDGFRVWPYLPREWNSLAPAAERADAILLCGDVLAWFPVLQELEVPLIVDGYDPHTLETLALFARSAEQGARHQERQRILRMQCQAGDFFICASERQRDWWLGLLAFAGRINVHTYADDPSLRSLIDVVPFGLPSSPPRHTRQVLKGVWPGIAPEDKVVLWGGGLWQWLDPLTAIRAVARLAEQRDDVKLVFPGTRHPNPSVPHMPVCRAAVQLAEDLGLRGRHVFFGDWVPYEEWPSYLLESDIGLSLHLNSLETRFAFRSRLLDYIWASLPMVVTEGDATSDLVADLGLGEVIGYEQEEELATALLQVLDNPPSDLEARFAAAQAMLTWEKAGVPLVSFCKHPHPAPDRAGSEVSALPSWSSRSQQNAELEALSATVDQQQAEIDRLQVLTAGYEQGRFIRMMKWLHSLRLWRTDA